jgi:MFS transporter, DHA1 family, inner membrane transport protein
MSEGKMSKTLDVVEAGANSSSRVAILALSLGAFAVGTSEFMISGLLQTVAADLAVSVPTAGFLITGYALGVVVGGPAMALLTGGLNRRTTLLLLLTIFVLGNLLCANAPSYALLLAGRVVTSFCHGAFYGLASVVGGALVASSHRARAVALVTAGVMVANVIGVPIGTAIGQALGWRSAFWVVALVGGIAATALVALLPSSVDRAGSRLLLEVRALARPRVLMGLGLCFVFTLGLFGLFSYITPMLVAVSGANAEELPILLLLFGLGSTVGVLVGGRLGDWNLMRGLIVAFAAQAITYGAILAFCQSLAAMYALMFALGAIGMVVVAPLKTIVLAAALDAPVLASTLASSALNLGVAVGAAIGALVVEGAGYGALPWIGLTCATSALIVALAFPLIATRVKAAL